MTATAPLPALRPANGLPAGFRFLDDGYVLVAVADPTNDTPAMPG